jgi:alkylated DNA repair protein (DNA oxidative demethylase)
MFQNPLMPPEDELIPLDEGAALLKAHAAPQAGLIAAAVGAVIEAAPLRRMHTPGGRPMSVAMTSCGEYGWVSDRRGYRYSTEDPASGLRWPPMPAILRELARDAAARAGFAGFEPDSCLINRYEPGARMSLHQDRDEADFGAPIVSVSLGLPAVFLWGGFARSDRPRRVLLEHGDVVVWGGASRLRFHGVMPIEAGPDGHSGERTNLTFRKAG